MSFESAIPLNRFAYGRDVDFDLGSRGGSAHGRPSEEKAARKQSVNISEDTLLKVARAKLHRMVDQRLGYDQRGALAGDSVVGSLLSTKA
ncbi:hypothetical protein VDG1235_4144 [Verrucomicrobiia bacterium DG1235]|nr:hypothetical protein VDG1235_4144 [Verrucomicrobiae bacterium DG1235]